MAQVVLSECAVLMLTLPGGIQGRGWVTHSCVSTATGEERGDSGVGWYPERLSTRKEKRRCRERWDCYTVKSAGDPCACWQHPYSTSSTLQHTHIHHNLNSLLYQSPFTCQSLRNVVAAQGREVFITLHSPHSSVHSPECSALSSLVK